MVGATFQVENEDSSYSEERIPVYVSCTGSVQGEPDGELQMSDQDVLASRASKRRPALLSTREGKANRSQTERMEGGCRADLGFGW
mmetsp:Transcript_7204/g.24916  ORF Transcript_7204/g.24916 Transcript_7204/m.24916 type:complete len:86 (-) Transcript_7204:154-411(-)